MRNVEGEKVFRIAICDDRQIELDRACEQTKKWLELHYGVDGRMDTFHSAEELKVEIKEKPWEYDLYILDIVMQGENGIQFGSWIRRYHPDALMIYVTSSRDYALDAFDNHAIRYLMKPVDEKEFQMAMDTAYALYQAKPRHVLTIQNKNGVVQIIMEEIMYIENNLKNITYVMRDGRKISQLRRQGSFEDAVGEVAKTEEFIQPHKSFFVNLRYVASLQDGNILMDDGKILPISRRRVADTQNQYIQYLSGVSVHE